MNLTTPSCGLDVPCAFRLRVFRHEKRKFITFIGLKVISRYFGRRLSRRGGKKGTFTTKWWESNPALPGHANQKGGHYRYYTPDLLTSLELHIDPDLSRYLAIVERRVRALTATEGIAELEDLSRFLLRSEAIASSQIEGIVPAAK
ncbi:hypothetical protein [Trueperella pyogenes]|uniref:hypothetical protein n=1 Tax=Trueperella pyogenes TaxID=1661 RepID=UPI000B2E05A0|nr:hypothetical protein [Trueperella pyogenes]